MTTYIWWFSKTIFKSIFKLQWHDYFFSSISSEDPLGPVCEKCNCFGHAETCHPITGECVTLQCIGEQCPPCVEGMEGCGGQCVGDECDGPESDPQTYPDPVVYCHFNPDKCVVPTPIPTINVTWTVISSV